MPTAHTTRHCLKVTSVAGSMGLPGSWGHSHRARCCGSKRLLTREASLGHMLVPSNARNLEGLALFSLRTNNPGGTNFPKLKLHEQSMVATQRIKRSTKQPLPWTQKVHNATNRSLQKMATKATPAAPLKAQPQVISLSR